MASRLKLHDELKELLGSDNVYFQPPESVKMRYECIRYSRPSIDTLKADDRNYRSVNRYVVYVIGYDPETVVPQKILEHFPMCSFDNSYVSNNLYHFVLTLYY